MMMRVLFALTLSVVTCALKAPRVIPSSLNRVVLSPLPVLYVYDHCPFCGEYKGFRLGLGFGLEFGLDF
jgi:hypothetical protein